MAKLKKPAESVQGRYTALPHSLLDCTAFTYAQAREIENQQSKLMEAHNGEWLDTGTAGATIGVNPGMATLGEINGAENN